jgi:hypothetical protein
MRKISPYNFDPAQPIPTYPCSFFDDHSTSY